MEVNPVISKMTSFIVMDILDKANEMQKSGIDIIHMEVGEPDFQPAECINNATKLALDDNKTHYTHSLGNLRLRDEIVKYYKREYNVKLKADQILITSGSSPAILMALMVANKTGKGEVIISNPGYSCYKNFALAAGLKPIFVNVSADDGFQYPIDELKKKINSNTSAIIINSPMNPTGTLIPDEVLKEISELNVPIISDEIYHGLTYEGRAKSILEFTDNAFVINGFSKKYAMTGFRLGYLIAPEDEMRSLQILQQNLFICAPSISQEGAIAALQQADSTVEIQRNTYNERRIFLINKLREIGFKIESEPKGAFYIFANAKKFTNDSYNFAFEILENAHVGITPGVDFGTNGEGYVRFSYANSLENLKEGMRRLEEYLKNR